MSNLDIEDVNHYFNRIAIGDILELRGTGTQIVRTGPKELTYWTDRKLRWDMADLLDKAEMAGWEVTKSEEKLREVEI